MANKDAPRGARCITPDVDIVNFAVSSDNDVRIGKYDWITPLDDGYVTRAAANEVLIGTVETVRDSDGVPTTYLAASTVGSVDVAMAAEGVKYVMQDDASATSARTNLHNNCDILDGNCSTVTGISIQEIAIDGATSDSMQLRLLGLHGTPGNDFGDNAEFIITVNESYLGSTSGK